MTSKEDQRGQRGLRCCHIPPPTPPDSALGSQVPLHGWDGREGPEGAGDKPRRRGGGVWMQKKASVGSWGDHVCSCGKHASAGFGGPSQAVRGSA